MPRLKDILQQQRKLNFVGREKELSFFRELLKDANTSTHLLYIKGPGGQGKTTLLKQFGDICKESSISVIRLDCRYIEPHPASFQQAFVAALPFEAGTDIMSAIEAKKGKVLLKIDTYEKLKPLDDWLRTSFLPELPGNVLTVIAGRSSLSTQWRTDPGWHNILKEMPLKELSKEESAALLGRRRIPADQVKRIVKYTHGNALALSIVADMFDQRNDSHFDPLDSPDIMKALLEQFVNEVPSPAHKAALELCSLLYVTTEKIIEEVLGPQMANELFNWLTTLTIIEKGPSGIYLHDIVRDAVSTELHWRNPEWYRHLHLKAQQYLSTRLLKSSGQRQRELIFNLIFLHRLNPAVKHFFEFQETGSSWQDTLQQEDLPLLQKMVAKYEGRSAAECFVKWTKQKEAEVWVFRDADKTPAGFTLKIDIEKISDETHDPVINALLPLKKEWKAENGQLLTAFRSWMSRDSYQSVSGVQSAIFLGIVQWYFTPGLAISMVNCAHPGFWQQILNYADLYHVAELDYELNNKTFGWYMHDWRRRTPLQWLELMSRKEVNDEVADTGHTAAQTAGITEKDFTESVHEALKQLKNPKKIIGNPLLRSAFVQQAAGDDNTEAGLALTLADRISAAISSLENSPKDETLHRVLHRTFVNPVGSQEQTADFLYMSFSTYRRQVKRAVERVADILWLEEKTVL
ncbi:MAG: AAA family ATPase [Chitinophagaceae bacterium]|nr:AAA family ATPase [Chitinophagaceae bacterium]